MKTFIQFIEEESSIDLDKLAADLHNNYPEHYSSGIAATFVGSPRNSDIIKMSGMDHDDFGSRLTDAIKKHRGRLFAKNPDENPDLQ